MVSEMRQEDPGTSGGAGTQPEVTPFPQLLRATARDLPQRGGLLLLSPLPPLGGYSTSPHPRAQKPPRACRGNIRA